MGILENVLLKYWHSPTKILLWIRIMLCYVRIGSWNRCKLCWEIDVCAHHFPRYYRWRCRRMVLEVGLVWSVSRHAPITLEFPYDSSRDIVGVGLRNRWCSPATSHTNWRCWRMVVEVVVVISPSWCPRSHQNFLPVPTVKLLRNRCRPTTPHTSKTGDGDRWCHKWLVWSTPHCRMSWKRPIDHSTWAISQGVVVNETYVIDRGNNFNNIFCQGGFEKVGDRKVGDFWWYHTLPT